MNRNAFLAGLAMGAASEAVSYAGAAIMPGAYGPGPSQLPPLWYIAGVCVLAGLACGLTFALVTWAGDRVSGFTIRSSAAQWRWAAGIGVAIDCIFGFFVDGMLMHSQWGRSLPFYPGLAFEIATGFVPGIITALIVLWHSRSTTAPS